jgi:hypothetical protein
MELPPINVLIDQTTGKSTQFNGYNAGPYHAGDVNGLAVDPNTGIAATDTELNAQVEFYDLAKQKGIADIQLPCTGDASQLDSGSGIAVDPVNKLFLVTEMVDACTAGVTVSSRFMTRAAIWWKRSPAFRVSRSANLRRRSIPARGQAGRLAARASASCSSSFISRGLK